MSPDPTTQTRSIFEAFLRRALNETHDRILYQMTPAQKSCLRKGFSESVIIDTSGLAYCAILECNGGIDAILLRTDNTSPHRHIHIVLL